METLTQAMTEACRANLLGVLLVGLIYFLLGMMMGVALSTRGQHKKSPPNEE